MLFGGVAMKEYKTAAWVREEADAFVVLGKPGFDEKRAELNARPAEDPAYIL